VRFTLTKLVGAVDGNPSQWVAYTRDEESGAPDYDTGSALVSIGNGVYTFTFNTDVASVEGVPYEPTLTHRLAGQIAPSGFSLQYTNPVFDFVPAGGALPETRNIAVMETCNGCHDGLVFHGRRFKVEYCVNCHNPDLAEGEADMSFMIHRIHSGGVFEALVDRNGDPYDFSHVTYPQDIINCRRCHDGSNPATPDGDNWRLVPNFSACGGCHNMNEHPGGPPANNSVCTACHNDNDLSIDESHATANSTPNNPLLLEDQRNIAYELIEAQVDKGNVLINFRITSDGEPLNMLDLPNDLALPGRFPGFLLAWAEEQDGIQEPADFTNTGMRGGQPVSFGIGDFSPLWNAEDSDFAEPVGSLVWNSVGGVNQAVIDNAEHFPFGATMRTVGLQGYFRQDVDEDGSYEYSLHTPSAVVTVTGDTERRVVVDNAKCGACHEWFEGHGGNRVYEMAICTMCHTVNTSSSGRTIAPDGISGGLLEDFDDYPEHLPENFDPDDPLTYPEDAQNFKDMIHGIHASGFRDRAYTHVRGGRQGYYDWSHITFPAENGTRNCMLCHIEGTNELPLPEGVLATTVRTTDREDGQDSNTGEPPVQVEQAFLDVPNETDWVNTPVASSCFYCHTSEDAASHMKLNGAQLSNPASLAQDTGFGFFVDIANRIYLLGNEPYPWTQPESCNVCHGPGRSADVAAAHSTD
jgi:OmcA/MtrC family decaheme c-type cytochrome